MRQNIMLDLTVHKDFQSQLDFTQLLVIGIKLHGSDWPEDSQAVQEQDQIELSVPEADEVAPPSETEVTNWWETITDVYEGTTIEKLSESYELGATGQERFWVRQRPWNSCFSSFPFAEGGNRCRNPAQCLYCCGKFTK